MIVSALSATRVRVGVALLAIILAGWYGFHKYDQHQKRVAAEQRAHPRAVAAAKAKHAAELAAREAAMQLAIREAYPNVKTSATLTNRAGGTARLYTALPKGALPDRTTSWLRNAACEAAPHGTCTIEVYAHRGIRAYPVTQYSYLGLVAGFEIGISDRGPNEREAAHARSDSNCCYLGAR